VPVAVVVAFVGLVAGQLLTDACGTGGECSSVEALALAHVPLQAAVLIAGQVLARRRADQRRRRAVLLTTLAASPAVAVALHLLLVAHRNRLIDGG
jgi:hypothetical protein